jgi:hypothetical protein
VTPATHCVGIVTGARGDGYSVTSGEVVSRARRASSCLLEPAPGDSVACLIVAPDELWILAILQREDGTHNVLRCEGPTRLEVTSGALQLDAETLQIDSGRFALRAASVDVETDKALVLGRELRVIGSAIKLVGSLMSTLFDRVTHHSKHHLRTTEGLDRVQATHLEQQAEQLLRLSGEHTLINGEKLVKTRGSQIHFG